MEGTSHKLLSLFIAVTIVFLKASVVQGEWNSDDCVNPVYGDDAARCPDYGKIIDCFKNAINLPEVSKMPSMKEYVEGEIKYFESIKKEQTCAGQLENGICLEEEVKKCQAPTLGRVNSLEESCKNVKTASKCLTDLKSKCVNSTNLDYLIEIMGDFVEDCTTGKYKQQIEEEKCQKKAMSCTDEIFDSIKKKKFDDACAKIQSSAACLDNAESACSDHVRLLKSHLNKTSEQCATGFLTGKCSYRALDKCVAAFYRPGDDMFGNFNTTSYPEDPCDDAETNVKAAQTCLSELKPFCKAKQQMDYFEFIEFSAKHFCIDRQK